MENDGAGVLLIHQLLFRRITSKIFFIICEKGIDKQGIMWYNTIVKSKSDH